MNSDLVVLIPHFNNTSGLRSSLASIKFTDKVDVLIVDDGSSRKPDPDELEEEFSEKLNLHFLFNQENIGIEKTLNKGLTYILEKLTCQYVARLDCGDLCHPMRFIKQKKYLDENRDVYLIGSWVKFFATNSKESYIYKAPSKHEAILQNMYIKCSFIHPSVMFRTDALPEIGLYPLTYKAAEDYAFFFKFIKNYKTYIIPETLTYCEMNTSGISSTKRKIQLKSKIKVILTYKSLSPYFIAGLLRNIILLIVPVNIITRAKFLLYK